MSRPRLDLIGQRFGALTVRNAAGKDATENTMWRCVCDCGAETTQRGSELRRKAHPSCGCLAKETQRRAVTKHGFHADRLHRIWIQMVRRTTNSAHISYARYGARGIVVCAAWLDSFDVFKAWALCNGYADSLSIDRINNDGHYEPSNCRWATPKEQAVNRRTRSKKGIPVKTFKQICAQGEITTDVVSCLPKGAALKRVEPVNGKLIVSHSESGHHHYIPAADADLLERTDNVPPGMQIFYSVVKRPTRLMQDAATPHDEIALDALIFRHRVAREFDPFAEQARRVAD